MTDLERRLKKAKDATADAGASSEHSETDLERMLRIAHADAGASSEHSETDLERMLRIAHEDKKQYTRSGASRRKAIQNRTESFMDIVTQGETEARAGIDRYKANRDADYYQQMNKAGATYRDQDMLNRSVTGYKGAYDLWKTAFDRETDAATARTRREREMTENPAKAPTVSDIVSRYSGKTKTLADLGNNVRGAIDAYKRQSDAAKAAPTPEEARQQAEESVQYWQNVAREAARYGDVYRQATARKHLADSVENYSRATKGYFDNLKNTDPGTYYALTMTPEEIDRELELLNNGAYLDSKITNSLTNDERIMGEYWHRTPQEQRQYEHNLERARFAGETDDERNAYISSEKEAYRDARNRMLNDASVEGSVGSNQEPYNRREEITQANEARKSVLENARMTQKVIQAEREGITNDPQIIASGKQKFEKDQQEIWNNSTVQPGWTPGSSAQTSLYLYQRNYSSAYKNGYVLDSMTRLTDEQRNIVYALYDRDPQTALKLAQMYAKALDDKVYQEIFDWVAKDSGWQFGRRAVGNLAGAVMNLASGLDPFGYGGQSAGKVGDALIGGAAQSATRNGWFGIEELGGDQSWIDSSVPFIGRGRAGEASQLVSSMEQSALTTLPAMIAGRYDAAAASWLETAGLLLQSSSAARSDYRESIEAGLDDTTAKIHAVAAGIAEYTFEKVSFDKLLAQNTSRMTFKKVMKDVLVQAGIEGSEELHTTLANTIMDEIISGDGKSRVDRRIAELVQGGMSMKEAKGVAEKEWLTGIVNDFIGGAASGGFMTGAHYAVGATVNTAENKIANNAVNQLVGQYAGAQTENFTDADTIEAAKNYAEARGIDASGLTEAAAKARDASVDEAMSALRGSTQSESETEKLSKRDSRKAGKAWTEIRTQISQDFDGKSGAQAAQLYDQMAEQYGAGIKTIVDEVVTTQARQSYLEQSQTAQELQQKVKPQVEALPEGGYKQASMRAYDQAEYQLRQQEAAKTADRLAKAGNIDTEVTYTNKDGSETTAQIADLSDDLASVVLDNGETVPIKDVQMSADTASAIRIFSRIAGKKAASLAFREYRAYLNNGGTEGYRFAEAVATAYGQGLNGVLTLEQALKMAPDFAQEAAERAFSAGRSKHQANIENEQARRKAAEEKAKAEGAQTVKGELRGEGSIKWEKMNATRRTRAQNQIKYLDSIAQGIGVDIEIFQSEATRRGKRMAYRGEQGAWYVDKATGKPVIRIDVNAGANFISDLNAALIATTGHELAHHFQHISPAVYDEYRQAVVQAILSTENGYEKLQRLIEHEKRINRRADGTTISTDEAIDEVVADASRDRVGDRNLWKNVADSMSDESRGKVAQWLHDRFSKILKLTKRYAGFEAADLVLQSAQEYQDLIGELWQKLATQAANAVDVRESDYEAGVQAKENPFGENNSTQRNAARSVEETDAEYMDAVKRGDMESAQRMVDEAAKRAGYNSPKLYHGTNRFGFTVVDSKKANDRISFFTTDSPETAGTYSGTTEARRISDANVSSNGMYQLYANTNDFMELDAGGSESNHIDLGNAQADYNYQMGTKGWRTHVTAKQAASYAKSKGFPGVVIHNVIDTATPGSRQTATPANVYVFFNPQQQVKSADPVTYDDAGNVIPLSERFNAKNEDIRYSERDELASDNQVHDLTNRSGETVGVQDGNGHMQFSQRTWRESGKEKMQEYLDERVRKYEVDHNDPEGMPPADAKALMDAVQEQYDALDEIVRQQPGNYKTYEEWADAEVETDIFGNPVFSWLKANGDYGISGDASLICVKRRTLDAVFDYMIRENMIQDGPDGLKLAQESIVAINDIIRAHGFETACSTCYIDARRYRAAIVAGSFCNVYNKLVRSMLKGKTGVPINAFNFGGNKSVTPLANSLDTLSDSEINWDGINKAIRDQEAKWESKGWEKFTEDGEVKWRRNGTVKNLPTSGTTEYRIALALKEKPSLRKLALRSDFLSGNGFLELNRTNKDILTLYNVKKGQAGPKATETDIQYLHEALENSFITPDRMFKAGGFRLQSFSDYVPRLVFDYVEIIGDLAAKGVPAHMYTKEILCVLQHGLTGTKINMSLIPAMVKNGFAPGLDADGNYLWRDGQTFGSTAYSLSPKLEAHLSKILGYQVKGRLTGAQGFELAKLIQNDPAYGKNNGTIAIGVSEAQIRKMLDDADIRMVIPYHKSGLNHILASMMEIPGFENYESYQNTLKWNGTKWSKVDVDFDFNEAVQKHKGDARAAAQDYLDWCKENGYKPKFSGVASGSARNSYNKAYDFTQHADWQTCTMTGEAESNYYKVLADFTCYDAEGKISRQEAVKLNYPGTDSAFGSMKQLIEMGLESDAMLQAKQDAEVPKIVEDIRREIPKFEAAGRNMKAYAQLKENVEGRQFSERDYGQVSDLDVVESLDEKKATTPEAKALIREAKEKAEKIRKLEQKLSELRGELKTTDRALNTRGITKLSSDMLKRMSMSNDYYENLSGWLSGKITEVYQNALDQMDRTGSVRAAGDALYNGAQEIADFLMQNAGYHENIGGKWQRARWASQFTQNEEQRQAVMNDVFASLIRDWSENRNRAPMHETEADRIAQRATRPVQKKLDETRAKLETARAENAEMAEKNASLTRDYESSRDYAGYLREYAKSLRKQLNDAEKAVKLAGKTTQKQEQKIADLKRKLHDALQAKKAMENAKQRAERAGERTASRLQRQLEAQIEREQRIMEGKLKPLAIQRMLAEARDTATAKARAQAQERFANQKENRKRGELRARIINLADEIQRTATRPTESKYVPASLYGAMSETLGMVNDLLESDNTKGAAKRLNIGQKILELKNEYEKIKSLDDAAIKSEYDEDISMHLGEIETVLRRVGLEPGKSYHGMTLRDLPTQTLQDLYDEISAIYKSMRDARKALAGGRAVDISTIQNSIIEQQAGIDSLNEIGKIGKLARNSMLDGLSTMRAVEMMSGWNRNAALYKTVSRIEDGAAEAARWSMNYNKRMQPLKTGKNELTYRNALTKRLDWQNAKDMNSGKPVKMTKLQALQIYMSWLREESDPRVQHLHEGGTVTIRDARDVLAGKASRAASNDIRVTPELMQEIKQSLTEWDQQYMDAIHEYMTEEGEATNKIHYQVKHKVLKTSENYFPEMVNKDYVDAKLEETAADNLWVMAPGATNELRPGAKQPVIIDGTETVMAAHVRDMANYIGLALPIRDFAKVLNGKVATGEAYATTIRSSISPNFGQKGIDVLKHAAMDVQGGRKVERKTQIERYLNGLHGAFVRSTLLINPSVTIKQAASYAAIESILSYRAVVAGNRPIFSGSDSSHSTSLIAQIFMAPDSKTAQRIYDEIDEHTALHYQRRQGMSYEELAHEALRQSGWKTTKANLGARMEQNAVGRIVRKTGARLSPVQWIQRMDVATTAAIWVACKTQSKIDGFEAGTQEFWNHTTQLYERCLRETQPMYDPLHRSERQKGGGLMQYLFPFRTVPFQNHGQIVASFEAMKAAKGTSRAKEATRFFRKTVVAQVKSAIVFSALSMLAAGLRHKPDEYMDENGEVDIGAMLGKLGIDTASTLFSVIFPLTGSETWEFGESQVNKFLGKDGKQWDIFSVGAVEMLNDMFKAAGNVVGDAAKAMQGEKVTKDSFKNHVTKLLLETSAVLGIPLENIKKYSEGIVKDVGEILDGKIPAFNNDAIERGTATNIDRYLKAWSAGDEKKRKAVLEELRGNLSASGKDEKQVDASIRENMNAEAKKMLASGTWDIEKAILFVRSTGAYDDDAVNEKVKEWCKQAYASGRMSDEEAIAALKKYATFKKEYEAWNAVRAADQKRDYLRTAFLDGKKNKRETVTALQNLTGMDEEYASRILDQWNAEKDWKAELEYDTDKDFDFREYADLYAAFAGKKDIGETIRAYKENGYSDKQMNDNIPKAIKAAYSSGALSESKAIQLLTRYVTETKNGEIVKMDENSAWDKVNGWAKTAEHTDENGDVEEGYSYSRNKEIFDAINANKDIKGLVEQYAKHSDDPEKTRKDIMSDVKTYLVDRYAEGKTASETALKNQLSRYCGIVKTDEVSEIVNSANCKKTTGYYPDSLKDGYVDGKLSKDNVISALKVYKGLDSTSASNRVRAWDFQKEHPDLKWDSDRVDAYYDKRPEGGGKSAYEAGISVETYDDYRNRSAKAKGTDKDGDGRTDSGSKKAEILRIIDSLDLSRSQKDALYYINGWAASTIYEAPWH